MTRCTRCVMDTTDPLIAFDEQGVCNHCREFDAVTRTGWKPDGLAELLRITDAIKQERRGKPYDCIIGLSGGVDSSYLALKVKELGLRALAVHVDCGWNSELAVHNIEQVVRACGFDLFTHVVDWAEMKDLQRAYLCSGVANQDVPQDHAIFAALYQVAARKNIRHIVSGSNIATEAIFAYGWQGPAKDARNLQAIHRAFGKGRLRRYPLAPFWKLYFYYPFILRQRIIRPLNYLPYVKHDAMRQLCQQIGYKEYGRKHGESIFTRFFQNHYMPTRFGMDKRLPHLSSLIVTGQMTRDAALAELARPLYDPQELENDIVYFCKKLDLSRRQFDELLAAPTHSWLDYKNNNRLWKTVSAVQNLLTRITGKKSNLYG